MTPRPCRMVALGRRPSFFCVLIRGSVRLKYAGDAASKLEGRRELNCRRPRAAIPQLLYSRLQCAGQQQSQPIQRRARGSLAEDGEIAGHADVERLKSGSTGDGHKTTTDRDTSFGLLIFEW